MPASRDSKFSFTSECIEEARKTVAKHPETVAVIPPGNAFILQGYIHWSILYVLFIPPIVLFCHVVEEAEMPSAAQADPECLGAFVKSLSASAKMSEAAARLQILLQGLYHVASKYIEVRSASRGRSRTQSQAQMQQALDMYVQALGFAPENMRAAAGMGYTVGATAFAAGYGGGILGLLEQDMLSFTPLPDVDQDD